MDRSGTLRFKCKPGHVPFRLSMHFCGKRGAPEAGTARERAHCPQWPRICSDLWLRFGDSGHTNPLPLTARLCASQAASFAFHLRKGRMGMPAPWGLPEVLTDTGAGRASAPARPLWGVRPQCQAGMAGAPGSLHACDM